MDKFNQMANRFLREYGPPISSSDNEIMVQMKSGKSFGDFLRSIVGKSRKDILDSGSFARLYSMNVHGIGGNKNFPDSPEVLLSRFLTKFGDYVNQDITNLRSGAAETDEFKKKHDYQGHLEREKERKDLFREIMKEKDPEKKSELRQKMNAFRNNSEYAEARRALYNKEDVDVDGYHNRPIEQGELVNDMRGASIEDQENALLSKDQEKALGIASKLATQAAKSGVIGFRKDPQKEINKAYGRVMNQIAKKINNIDI